MKNISILSKSFILLIFTFIIVYLSIRAYAFITPKFQINTNDSIVFYDINNNSINELNNNNNYVLLKDINQNVINAIISIEDKKFYSHNGFDYLRILKAFLVNIKNGDILQGASTISQQYIKNLYLTFDKTWERKIQEAFLTLELETHYSKDEILEGYLNTINFGAGNYGILDASKYYFNKHPKDLNLAQASMIVGIPRNPTYYNPITNYVVAKKRQKTILESMVRNKYITKEEMEKAYGEKLDFYAKQEKNELSSIYYYKDAVMSELSKIDSIPKSLLDTKGLKIYTNLDIDVQKKLENNIDNEIKNSDLEISSIVVKPNTGKIVALIGGKDYTKSQYNRAYNSKRQVGSTIKPLLYYSALENGFNPSSTFLSERTTFNLGSELYSPKNASNIYANKNITMLAAIAYSDNIYAIKTHLFLGMDNLSNIAKRTKINTNIKENASSALGTSEINMIDYSNAFITLANEGKHESPHLIEKITDKNNNVIYEYKYNNEQLLNNRYVYILNNMLTSTYDYNMINYTSPTLISISNLINGKYAIKSGSTDTDYWTIGYNKDYLMMVWAGYDDNKEVLVKDSRITKNIWAKTINNIEDNKKTWYEIPKGITATLINPITGDFDKNGSVSYFEKGSEPTYSLLLKN